MGFLLDNPFLIIVIISIIFSFFKKKDGGSQQHKNVPPKPQHQPVRTQPNEQHRPIFGETRNTDSRSAEEKMNMHEREYLERKKQAESMMDVLKEQQRLKEKQAELIQLTADKHASEPSLPIDNKRIQSKSTFSAGKQQLIDGLIWSEILGPPKARNPHRSLRGK